MDTDDFVTMTEAQQILGVSNQKIWRMVKDGELTAYESRMDRRRKMVRRSDLEALTELRPIDKYKNAGTSEPA